MRHRLRTYLIAGLLVVLPLAVTFLVLRWLFTTLDSVLLPLFRRLGWDVPGLGLIAGVALILLVGAVASNMLGRRVIAWIEGLVLRLPLARTIYSSIRDLSSSILGDRRAAFQQVVLIEWPRRGTYALGFITGRHAGPGGEAVHVFVPGTPNPTAGFVVIARPDEAVPVALTVEEALRFIISGGMSRPPEALVAAIGQRRREEVAS